MRSPFWLSLVLATLATMICPAARGATSIVDPTFRVGALTATQGPDGLVTAMDRYSDGRVIIAGDFARVDGRKAHGIARLRSDGSNDTTFDVGTGPDRLIRTVVVLPDGRALVGGDFGSWNGTPAGQHIVRLNADGSRDVGYPAGIASTGSVRQLLVRPDGRVLVLETLGPEANGKHALKLLSGDGLRDPRLPTGHSRWSNFEPVGPHPGRERSSGGRIQSVQWIVPDESGSTAGGLVAR